MSGGAGPLVPTFHGFVHNSMDGLILFEACLSQKLHHVPRRPHDRERSSLIKSGSIFIYEENASGIKRWTDGVAWSPSRILGNFLIYRELEKPFPPGEKKRAMKRKRMSVPGEPYPRRDSDDAEAELPAAPPTPPPQDTSSEVKSDDAPGSDGDKELERSLIGSLVDSYGFRPDGLVKKTMSITYQGVSHHMVSYYKVEDVKGNLLPRPGSDSRLSQITIRPELYMKQNFRAPVEETEHFAVDGQMHVHPSMMYHAMAGGPYGVRPGTYFGQPPYAGMYGMPPSTGAPVYAAMSTASWPAQQATAGASPYGQHPGYASTQSYPGGYYPQKQLDQTSASAVTKVEPQQSTSQAVSYPGQHAYSSYPPMQRSGSQSAPSIVPYQTPGQPASSQFAPMGGSARGSYSGPSAPSPTTNGHSQQMYGGSSQQYPVRSPTQSYGVQSAPSSAVSPSPHSTIRSPQSTLPGTPAQSSVNDVNSQMHASHMPYRSHSYAGPSGHTANEIAGLGISNNSGYAQQTQNNQAYNYGANTQAFRPVGSATAQSAGQYAS